MTGHSTAGTCLIVTIRPAPGCHATVTAAAERGLTVAAYPLFRVQPLPWQGPEAAEVDGLLIGSANAIRHGGEELARYRQKPVYAVGDTTAQIARAAGFAVAAIGIGGLQGVLDRDVPRGARLLRLAGEDHVPLSAPPGVWIDTRILYASRPAAMGADLADGLRQGSLVLLHSAIAATHFAQECDRHGVPRAAVRLASLGPRIATAAGAGWAANETASHPREAALLALAAQMCQ